MAIESKSAGISAPVSSHADATKDSARATELAALSSEAWQLWALVSSVYDSCSGITGSTDLRATNQLGWMATAAEQAAKRLAVAIDELREVQA